LPEFLEVSPLVSDVGPWNIAILRRKSAGFNRTFPFSDGKHRFYVEHSRFPPANAVFRRRMTFLRRTFPFSDGKHRFYVEHSRFPPANAVFRRRTAFLRRTFPFSAGERRFSIELFEFGSGKRCFPVGLGRFPVTIEGRRQNPVSCGRQTSGFWHKKYCA